jgi:hypothetical protein
MSKEQPPVAETDPGAEQADEEQSRQPAVSAVGMANLERTFLRLTFWQTLLSLAGVFTGAVALYAALSESQAVREQTAAAVWPYVQLTIEDTDDGETAYFALSLENVGVGPARMQGLVLTVDGQPQRSWETLLDGLMESAPKVGVDFGRTSVSRRVIAPGESITMFQTSERELAIALQKAVYGGRAELRFCYCSIFQDCWQSRTGSGPDVEPGNQPVDACPDARDTAFKD